MESIWKEYLTTTFRTFLRDAIHQNSAEKMWTSKKTIGNSISLWLEYFLSALYGVVDIEMRNKFTLCAVTEWSIAESCLRIVL